jgi:hypothetical protein
MDAGPGRSLVKHDEPGVQARSGAAIDRQPTAVKDLTRAHSRSSSGTFMRMKEHFSDSIGGFLWRRQVCGSSTALCLAKVRIDLVLLT